jgi:hypothetical protein
MLYIKKAVRCVWDAAGVPVDKARYIYPLYFVFCTLYATVWYLIQGRIGILVTGFIFIFFSLVNFKTIKEI